MGVLDFVLGRARASGGGGTSDLLNPKNWVFDALGIQRTGSGQRVSPESSMTVSVYFAAVRNIAEDLASLPWIVVLGDGTMRKMQPDHDVSRLFRDGMNPELDGHLGRELLLLWALGWGNGIAEIERRSISDPTPVALWPIHPGLCRPVRDPQTKEPGIFVSGFDGNPAAWIPREDVFHLRGAGDADWGWSIARLAAQDLGNAMAATAYEGSLWANGATSRVVLKYPRKLDDKGQMDRLRRSWAETYGGAEQSGKPVILEHGMELVTVSINPRDAQMLESIKNGDVRLARWLRMPPTKLGILDRATWNNTEQLDLQYSKETLAPWATRIEAQGRRKMLSPAELKAGLTLRVYLQALQRGDFKTRTEGYARQIGSGQLTPNEARALEDRNPDPRPEADLLYLPSNVLPMKELSKPKPAPQPPGFPPGAPQPPKPPAPGEPPAPPDEPAPGDAPDEEQSRASAVGAVEALVRYEVGRLVERVRLASGRAAKRHAEDEGAFREWSRAYLAEELPRVTAMLEPVVAAFDRVALTLGLELRAGRSPAGVAGALAAQVLEPELAQADLRFRGQPAVGEKPAADQLAVAVLGTLASGVSGLRRPAPKE